MKEEKGYYNGKLSPGGAKSIPALYPQKSSGDTKKLKGNDLRAGSEKK